MINDLFMRLAERAMGSVPVVEPFVSSVYSQKNTNVINPYYSHGLYEEKEDFKEEGFKEYLTESGQLPSRKNQTLIPYDLHKDMPYSRQGPAKEEDISSYNTDSPWRLPASRHDSDFQRNREKRLMHSQDTIMDDMKVLGDMNFIIPIHKRIPTWIDSDYEKHGISKRHGNNATKPEINTESILDLEEDAPIQLSDHEYKKRDAFMPQTLLPIKDVLKELSNHSEKNGPVGKQYRKEKETEESSLPTIRVNIKRIEVRALVQEAPKPLKTKESVPKLSLDEYLKQRREGKR